MADVYVCSHGNTSPCDECDKGYLRSKTTPLGQYLLRRQGKADSYIRSLPYGNQPHDHRDAFFAGWDKAVEEIGLMLQTPGGDGCFCAHHPDDPAHTAVCYSLIEYLTRYR